MNSHLLFRALLLVLCQISWTILLQPEKRSNDAVPYKVLVFGDSWGAKGPGPTMLEDMFQKHGVLAEVKSTAVSGTRACQWASIPENLADAASVTFPSGGPDFVWYTLGGNDLFEPTHLQCQGVQWMYKMARSCVRKTTRKINNCTDTMLMKLWDRFPNTKVVQCAYDLGCEEGNCLPFATFTYCKSRPHCGNLMALQWTDMLLGPKVDDRFYGRQAIYKQNPALAYDSFTGINIYGSVQASGHVPNASVGKPNLDQGSTCKEHEQCIHPIPGSPAANAIGDSFWELYFKDRVKPSIEPVQLPEFKFMNESNNDDGEANKHETYCRWDWVPSIINPTMPPKCDETELHSDSAWGDLVLKHSGVQGNMLPK